MTFVALYQTPICLKAISCNTKSLLRKWKRASFFFCYQESKMRPLGDCLLNCIVGFDDEGGASQDQQQIMDLRHRVLDHSSIIVQDTSSSTNCRIPPPTVHTIPLPSLLETQRLEMDWLLQAENQKLRAVVQEISRQQTAVLFREYECKILSLMREKDKELELARGRSMELQSLLMMAQEEAQALQKKALESEAMVLDLNSKLELIRDGKFISTSSIFNEVVESSFCESSNRVCTYQEEGQLEKMACKRCGERILDVVFLPCKHLCSCTACEPLLALCPRCHSVKESWIEVFFD